jgi:inosine-uridine nucleoside N-ribohydrolase
MRFPELTETFRLQRLEPPKGKVRLVIDTDTFNEIDDQFAVAYALKSPDRLQVEAIYAAPFHNALSEGPADGMEKSYREILTILQRLRIDPAHYAFRGSTGYLKDAETPQESEAARDLVRRAMASPDDDPLYVVAIGAITNVASAILMEPRIIGKIVLVWLGGHAHDWPDTREFNLIQDVPASRLVFDCGVPLVQVPCMGVASHLLTTLAELREYVKGQGELGDYLYETFERCHDDHFAYSRVIWDISVMAYLVNPQWVPTQLVHSPVLTDHGTWSRDLSRHFIRCAYAVQRDPIFKDLFLKLRR